MTYKFLGEYRIKALYDFGIEHEKNIFETYETMKDRFVFKSMIPKENHVLET